MIVRADSPIPPTPDPRDHFPAVYADTPPVPGSTLDHALRYATQGLAVFPVHGVRHGRCTCGNPDCSSPGKHPATPDGVHAATTDEATIRRWWGFFPYHNIGLATGSLSGLFVLDVDPRHGGDESLAALEDEHGPLPKTRTVETGGGGRHFYFTYNPRLRNCTGFMPGLDVKTDGGYVVIPPSVHISGGIYQFAEGCGPVETELAEAPGWLIERIEAVPGSRDSGGSATPSGPLIRDDTRPEAIVTELLRRGHRYADGCGAANEGGRNNATFALAGHLWSLVEYDNGRPCGLNEGEIMEVLHAWNARNPSPLDDTEVEAVCRSASINGIPRPPKPARRKTRVRHQAVLTRMDQVAAKEPNWLWRDRIAVDGPAVLVGRPGGGKSFLTTCIAAHVTRGRDWPDGTPCPQGSVLFVAAEDAPPIIKTRLEAHDADMARVHTLTGSVSIDDQGNRVESGFTLTDLDTLDDALTRIGDCGLVTVDPVGSYLGRADSHNDVEVRSVLAPVAELVRHHDAALLIVAHNRKSAAAHADDTVLGSRAFTGLARTVLHLGLDPTPGSDLGSDNAGLGDTARRLLLPGKNNLSRPADGLAFTIAGDPAALAWEPDPVDVSADDLARGDSHGGRNGGWRNTGRAPSKEALAGLWLRGLLATGPKPAAECIRLGMAEGHTERNLQRGLKGIGGDPKRVGFGKGSYLVWLLPGQTIPTQKE